jgi:alkylated DNA repair dioxygenase AlkB
MELKNILSEIGFKIENLEDEYSWVAYYKGCYKPSSSEVFDTVWNSHPKEYKTIKMYGKDVLIPRYQLSYGHGYNYSGTLSESVKETDVILEMKNYLNSILKKVPNHPLFNMCLCNWYEPSHYIGPHSDDTRQLYPDSPIASVSWGVSRRFVLTSKKTNIKKEFLLEDGDVIIMGGKCQETHKHEVPKIRKNEPKGNRINFTFRCFK